MITSPARIGIDCRGAVSYAARVAAGNAQPEIKALLHAGLKDLHGHHLLEGARVHLSVPDRDVLVRQVYLDESEPVDRELQGRFELSQTMLDDENEFMYDIIDTGDSKRFLGLLIRRTQLAQLAAEYYADLDADLSGAGYHARAVALGKGYLRYCRHEDEDFVCLVDFARAYASLCFVDRGHIVGVAHMPVEQSDDDFERRRQRLAAEFKTVVGYRPAPSLNRG